MEKDSKTVEKTEELPINKERVEVLSSMCINVPHKSITKKIKTITSDNIKGVAIGESTEFKLAAFDKELESLINNGWNILHIGHNTSEYRVDCTIASATLIKEGEVG